LALLEQKWIQPLTYSFKQLPISVIRSLEDKVAALAEKYSITFSDLESEIKETESALSSQIDELVGSDFDLKGLHEFQSLLSGSDHD
jgi:type I restriction enzyme M protein